MKKLQDISIQFIKGVGPARKRLFANLGVESVEDILYFFPRRYEDRRQMTMISQLKLGEYQTVCGRVMARTGRRAWYTKKHLTEAVLEDGSGSLTCVWFNQPYLENYFLAGRRVVVYGRVDLYKDRLQMVAPEYEIIEDEEGDNLSVGRIVPIYPLTRGMTQRYLRKVMRAALDKFLPEIPDALPVWLRNKHHLSNIRRSVENIHFPETDELRDMAMRRVSFEEFFVFQLSVLRRRMSIVRKTGFEHTIGESFLHEFRNALPFALTRAQERVILDIVGDMQKPSPMLRLLQGDVGSGKTVVALFGCLASYGSGYQAAIMAPTEILARQHYENIKQMTQGHWPGMRTELLASSLSRKEAESIRQDLADGKVHLVIGTHALLSEHVLIPKLSFVVIDEQHKFGVRQRALLSAKGQNPDVLVMTATPIPRTLSLTLYGDLDVSILDEMPPGRGRVVTEVYSQEEADKVYLKVREIVEKEKQQVYIVYPIIDETESQELKAAEKMFRHFQQHEFKGLRLGIVHGQKKQAEADEVMRRFKMRELDILVATTILEVGLDVPNAGVMVIEHADRFGLSQLHQLRGRIGRGHRDGRCFLIADPTTEEAVARLHAIRTETDGFKIAEQDLVIRGPGRYFGRHQHGLNELKFANPVTQIDILELARKEAEELLHRDADLLEPPNRILGETISRRYPTYLEMVEAG